MTRPGTFKPCWACSKPTRYRDADHANQHHLQPLCPGCASLLAMRFWTPNGHVTLPEWNSAATCAHCWRSGRYLDANPCDRSTASGDLWGGFIASRSGSYQGYIRHGRLERGFKVHYLHLTREELRARRKLSHEERRKRPAYTHKGELMFKVDK